VTRSGGGRSATRSYVYDPLGERLCKTIEPETASTVQAYDAASNVIWRASGLALPSTTSCDTDSVPANRKVGLGYDTLNRLTSTSYSDGSPGITRTYTADGLPDTIVSNGATWTNTYNNRRLNERESLVYGGASYNIDRSYDSNGSLLQLKYPDSTTISYAPNALGEASQVGTYARSISYHPNGAIAAFTYGNGLTHSMTQYPRGLPKQSTDGGVLNDYYTYDENANVAGIADLLAPSVSSRSMIYDNLDRLKTASAPKLWGSALYDYDALDNLTSTTITAGGTARSTIHNFELATNRLKSATNGPAAYIFDYGYDSQGNITKRGSQTYVFDQGNRMSSATGKATYGYDGLGHRFTVVGNDGVNRLQLYSQGGQLLQTGPTGAKSGIKYIYLHNHVLAEVNAAGTQYQHTDALGSPAARTDSAGNLVSKTRYEPYGLTAGGETPTIGFTGHVNDADTGLVYMQQRYYDPVAGRFLSIDPVTTDANTGGSFNRYSYAGNNPYKYIDPDGRAFCGSYQCDVYDSGNRPGGDEVIGTAGKVGAVAGGIAGAAAAVGCDIYSVGTCSLANPAIVAGGIAGGAAAGAAVGAMLSSGSALLAKNIVAATGIVKKEFEVSHHIVAENDRRASTARDILKQAGMDINSAFNGMTMSAKHHQGLHTDLYHISVAAALSGADSFGQVAARLTAIRAQIYMGIFPY
jgi:RHS repeat-associated protein